MSSSFATSFAISIHALREEGDLVIRRGFFYAWNFYPRPPRGGRRGPGHTARLPGIISIHALREEGDRARARRRTAPEISIHALREEGDAKLTVNRGCRQNFYPRPPRGGRPGSQLAGRVFNRFLSTPSARRATLKTIETPSIPLISIHALREEGDFMPLPGKVRWNKFLSTPSARRATCQFAPGKVTIKFLSTPSARRATGWLTALNNAYSISIHALREEGDSDPWPAAHAEPGFLSTPSARRATRLYPRGPANDRISIHALREEGDDTSKSCCWHKSYFYPRPPRGGRQSARME